MYTLIDTFNDRIISRHRTLDAAARAERRFSRAVKRANGDGSYIPTDVLDAAGESILRGGSNYPGGMHPEQDELLDARDRADGILR